MVQYETISNTPHLYNVKRLMYRNIVFKLYHKYGTDDRIFLGACVDFREVFMSIDQDITFSDSDDKH